MSLLADDTRQQQRLLACNHLACIESMFLNTAVIESKSQPYEITTDVGVKYSAKGEMQPEASVKVTRHLENGNTLTEIIRADLARGVEEMMIAIENIRKGGARL